MTTPLLGQQAFKEYITGLPLGVVQQVQNPATGETFNFDGTSGRSLLTTIADLSEDLGPDGLLREDTIRHWVGMLVVQLEVAPGQPLMWVCQQASDAKAIAAAFDQYAEVLDAFAADRVVEVVVQPPPARADGV